jgi:Zn-finger nucleic acid-binding protein
MKCPNCKNNLSEKITIGAVTIDKCSSCGGTWFEGDELRKVKDEKAADAKWFDFDLWKDQSSFKAGEVDRICPLDNTKLFKLNYDSSSIEIDACKECNGIWLDKGEFEKIIEYVKNEGDLEILRNYTKNLIEEGKEVFSGPESFKSEIGDLLLLAKMFQYKFMAQNPILTKIIMTRIPPLN